MKRQGLTIKDMKCN